MILTIPTSLAAWPIRLEYLSGWTAALVYIAFAVPIVLLGVWSLNGLGSVRKWVVIGVRLAVLLLFVLLIGGMRWQRQHKDLEIYAIVDVSRSATTYVKDFPKSSKNLRQAIDDYLVGANKDPTKKPDDRVGVIRFADRALIEVMPTKDLKFDTHPIPEHSSGTDAASAIQLALASLSKEAMHRLLLVWDGNQTVGDVDSAISAAAAQHVQIDVMPLHYDVKDAAMIERFIAPTWKRENEPFTIVIILRSTNTVSVTGRLSVTHETADAKTPLDMDQSKPGSTERRVTLKPGLNVEHVHVPALKQAGVPQFH